MIGINAPKLRRVTSATTLRAFSSVTVPASQSLLSSARLSRSSQNSKALNLPPCERSKKPRSSHFTLPPKERVLSVDFRKHSRPHLTLVLPAAFATADSFPLRDGNSTTTTREYDYRVPQRDQQPGNWRG